MKSHPGGAEHTRRMLALAALPEGARVLDMGAGAGESVQLMRSLGLDEAIMRYIRREKGLIIGQRTAEDLKVDLGSAVRSPSLIRQKVSLRGRDAASGKPATVEITAADVHNAIQPPLQALVENIRDAFENIPAELAEDILPQGLYLSGGGALLEGLPERLGEMLGLRVTMDEAPQDDTALGLCMIAASDRLMQKFEQSGCLIEI